MKDQIPILDEEYFRRKKEERFRERRKLRYERELQMLQKKMEVMERSRSNNFRPELDVPPIVSSVNRIAVGYIKSTTMTALDFEEKLDQKLRLYPDELCPITHFSKPKVTKSAKQPITVGDLFRPFNIAACVSGAIIAVVLMATGILPH